MVIVYESTSENVPPALVTSLIWLNLTGVRIPFDNKKVWIVNWRIYLTHFY